MSRSACSLFILSVVFPPYLGHNVVHTSMAVVAKKMGMGPVRSELPAHKTSDFGKRSADLTHRLVAHVEDWLWSSLRGRSEAGGGVPVDAFPVPLPRQWARWVNQAMKDAEIERLRRSVNRGGAIWHRGLDAAHGGTARP